MKKVMIGILILIPIIVLFIVAMVSSIISVRAWVPVEDLEVYYKGTQTVADNKSINLTSAEKSFADYFDVKVMPENANRYTLNWEIGTVRYTDEDAKKNYDEYLEQVRVFNGDFEESYAGFETENGEKSGKYVEEIEQILSGKPYKPSELKEQDEKNKLKEEIKQELKNRVITKVNPAVMLVDENGNEVARNSTGDFIVTTYCYFSLKVSAENHSRTINFEVVGDKVEKVTLSNLEGEDNKLVIGQSKRIIPVYDPIHSIVGSTIWRSDNESVATVDQNGIITAKGVGSANIYVKASKHGSEDSGSIEYVESSAYTVEVSADNCGSAKFGSTVMTAKNVITFEELGIVEASAKEGCTVSDDSITLTADVAKVETQNGELTIVKCSDGEIAISNAEFFEYGKRGYVLAVSDLTLKLKAVYKDMLSDKELQDVVWTSSNESVATVDQNGEVRGLSSGLVTITITADGKTSSITLNVQPKVASMILRTSNDYFAVGIAQETVFASEKYTDSMTKVPNSVRIAIVGEPTDADEQKAFYSAYAMEIVSGGEYVEFDANEKNRLVFKNTLEGKGRQNITIRVSALYPKYEGFTKHTTEEVTITAVYGVEVNNIAEMRQAAAEQKEYVHREGIFIERNMFFEHIVEATGEIYQAWNYDSSKTNYAIVLASNIIFEYRDKATGEIVAYDKERLDRGEIEAVTFESPMFIYGDVYGNNHMISTTTAHLGNYDKPMRFAWGNITVSNLTIRVNELSEDGLVTDVDADETHGFKGECMTIGVESWEEQYRLENINIEYCIFENARKFASAYNADLNIKGCVMRNMAQCSLYAPTRMIGTGTNIYSVSYLHLTTKNIVVSNSLGTFASLAFDSLLKYKDMNDNRNRFKADDKENTAYFMENFASKGINTVFNQKGFLDVYNWQDVRHATLIDTGNSSHNALISKFAGPMIEGNSMFKKFVCASDNKTYFHLGFILTGLGGEHLLAEPNLTEVHLEDKRFDRIYTPEIPQEGEGEAFIGSGMIRGFEITLYSYRADNVDKDGRRILPNSGYTMDSDLIERLHEE